MAKIQVKVSFSAAQILGTEWVTLDLGKGFTFRKSKDVGALTILNELKVEGILPFSVPFSRKNNLALAVLGSPIVLDNAYEYLECRAYDNESQLQFDRVYFRNKNEDSQTWDLEFRRSSYEWADLAKAKKLNTIDLGTDTLSAERVGESHNNPIYVDGAVPTFWALMDYGGWVDKNEPAQFTDPPVKGVFLEDLRPLISEIALLKQGFCEIGWTLDGSIFEDEWMRRRWVYLLSRTFYKQSAGSLKVIGKSSVDKTDVGIVPAFDQLIYDPSGSAIYPGAPGVIAPYIVNSLPYKAEYMFCIKGEFNNPTGTDVTLSVDIWEFNSSNLTTGVILVKDFEVRTLAPGLSGFVEICVPVVLEPGQKAGMIITATSSVTLKKGYYFSVDVTQNTLIRGDSFKITSLINPDYTLYQLFAGFMHTINGRIQTDYASRVITVYPQKTAKIHGNTVPGFIFDERPPIDLTEKTVKDSIQIKPIKNTLTRYTRLQFATSTDAYIDSLDLVEPPHSRKILNGLELPDSITEIQNPFYEPTIEGQPTTLKRYQINASVAPNPSPYLPRLWDNTNGEISYNIGPRIFYAFGKVFQRPADTSLYNVLYHYFEGVEYPDVAYATQKRSVDIYLPPGGTIRPDVDGTIVYGKSESDLYVLFYLGLGIQNKKGYTVDMLVKMTQSDYSAWDLRTRFKFLIDGFPVVGLGTAINDFANDGTATPLMLTIEPAESACCDGPCSCRFNECEYFQDFGAFVRQTTLDDIVISSFKVDGVEKLASSIGLGILNIVSIGGRAYVTNLVDALNSIGVDYFSFSYSPTAYSQKNDGRWFKIKYPACQTFEIILTDSGGDIYKYTESAMLQQWFGSGYSAFGYGGATYSTPQNCIETIEY